MAKKSNLVCIFLLFLVINGINAEDPYRFFTWKVTYGDIYPMGVKQQGILINGQFPGPQINCVTNDNLIISVYNYLNEPFLLSWNGLQHRRNSWQDGTFGTTCPIPPGKNFTYMLQAKDQIGSFFYFPSLSLHKAAGGYGGIKIYSRPRIPVPFPFPAGDHTVLAGDWYKRGHQRLRHILDGGRSLPAPDGLLINGRGWNGYQFEVDQGKTYRFRISNVGLTTSINFRIQGHIMRLVEVEGSHTVQNAYNSLDLHLGQSVYRCCEGQKCPFLLLLYFLYDSIFKTHFSICNLIYCSKSLLHVKIALLIANIFAILCVKVEERATGSDMNLRARDR